VLEGVAGMAKMLRVGQTLDPETMIGPLVSEVQLDRVTGYIDSGRQEGASVLVGGRAQGRPGWFVEPTVLVDTEASMKVRKEEIFGPVLCATRFSGEDDADRLAALATRPSTASTRRSGPGTSAWPTASPAGCARAACASTAPAGSTPALPLGGYKASGWGRENGKAGIEAYTELKAVSVALD
jgi:phenylacetaldehyde dehydrogenase